jgi:hypothetical protein
LLAKTRLIFSASPVDLSLYCYQLGNTKILERLFVSQEELAVFLLVILSWGILSVGCFSQIYCSEAKTFIKVAGLVWAMQFNTVNKKMQK